MEIKDIKIGQRIRKDVGDIESLVSSIKEIGLIHPITILGDGTLSSGYRRLLALEKLGRTELKEGEYKIFPLNVELEENLIRKEFTLQERVEAFQIIYEREKTKAKERQKQVAGKDKEGKPVFTCVELPTSEKGKARDKTAKFTGLAFQTYEKVKKVLESNDQKLVSEINRTGKVEGAWRKLKQKEDEKRIPAFPAGNFNIILADPPWQYSIINVESRATERHYPTLSYEQIRDYTDKTGRKITDLFSQNVILFLWVTAPKANEGFQLLKDWGFEYKTCFVWVKDKIGLGWWNRNQHELLLVATKGNVKIPDESARVSSIINAPRAEHSKKPNIVYEIIQKYYPEQKYLELFARQKYNEKWEVWGNEYLG